MDGNDCSGIRIYRDSRIASWGSRDSAGEVASEESGRSRASSRGDSRHIRALRLPWRQSRRGAWGHRNERQSAGQRTHVRWRGAGAAPHRPTFRADRQELLPASTGVHPDHPQQPRTRPPHLRMAARFRDVQPDARHRSREPDVGRHGLHPQHPRVVRPHLDPAVASAERLARRGVRPGGRVRCDDEGVERRVRGRDRGGSDRHRGLSHPGERGARPHRERVGTGEAPAEPHRRRRRERDGHLMGPESRRRHERGRHPDERRGCCGGVARAGVRGRRRLRRHAQRAGVPVQRDERPLEAGHRVRD